jgi:hypothetical protein
LMGKELPNMRMKQPNHYFWSTNSIKKLQESIDEVRIVGIFMLSTNIFHSSIKKRLSKNYYILFLKRGLSKNS